MTLGRKLSLAFAAVVLVVVLAALRGLDSLNQAITVYDTHVAGQVDSERAVADIESEFKTQVQKWKDVLLRGCSPDLFDMHWQAFVKVESHVNEEAATLAASLPEGQSKTLVSQFAQSHKQIVVAYRSGMDAFKPAQQIKTLIYTSVARVEHSTLQFERAGNTMNEVLSAIQRVTDMASQIARASQQQTVFFGQIGYIVTEMSHTTQQNAAMVEEMAAAAEGIEAQAKELVHTVAIFTLESDQTRLVWRGAA
jgi:hypothetical protein